MPSNQGPFEPVFTPIWMQEDEMINEPEESIDVASEAKEIIKERGRDYGPPSENHSCTAKMWNAYLNRRYGNSRSALLALDAEDVCWLNVLQKISRQAHVRKRDNKVDVIGFVINADML